MRERVGLLQLLDQWWASGMRPLRTDSKQGAILTNCPIRRIRSDSRTGWGVIGSRLQYHPWSRNGASSRWPRRPGECGLAAPAQGICAVLIKHAHDAVR